MPLATLKSQVSIAQVLGRYKLRPDKNNMLCCPFHADKHPSMKIYTETDTAYCFSGNCPTHGHSLDVIDFVMWQEGWQELGKEGKAKAIALVTSWVDSPQSMVHRQEPSTPRLSTVDRGPSTIALLTHCWAYFQRSVGSEAIEYLASRSLDAKSPALRPQIGYQAGKVHTHPPKGMSQTDYQHSLLNLGLIPASRDFAALSKNRGKGYRTWAKGCVIFPLRNPAGEIVSFYGRSTTEGHFYLLHRQGLFPKYPDPAAKTLILTESIIDAATLIQNESEHPVLALYGTNGLTEEHRTAISSLLDPSTGLGTGLREVIFFLDGDDAGEKAVQTYAKQLAKQIPSIQISQVPTPKGEDINSLAQKEGKTILDTLIKARITLFTATNPVHLVNPVQTLNTANPHNPPKQLPQHPSNPSNPSNPVQTINIANPNRLRYTGRAAHYQIVGGLSKSLDSLKVSLVIQGQTSRSRQKIDLYEDAQVEKCAKRAGDKLGLRADLLELDLNRLTDLLEQHRDEQLTAKPDPRPALDAEEETVAKHFLTTPKLMHRLNEALGKAGVVGEERNRLFLFCCASSYKQKTPLHVLSQGASGMGKTHAQEVIAACLPQEDVIEITRMTDYSFYNYGEHELSHKILFIEDMDSLSEEAMLALREMQSKGRISLSTTRKDDQGNLKAGTKTVYGPLATLGATTKGGLYEDNAGRCFILAVDESIEQTRRIISYQNQLSAGEIDLKEQSRAQELLQHCVRLLRPAQVINPFANRVNLPEEAHKLRRLNGFFNGLIAQITWIHQYQRKRDKQGRLIAEASDVKLGIELFLDALVWKIDELDGSMRGFYERLKSYVQAQGGEQYERYHFGRKEVRDKLRVSKTQQHRYFQELEQLEYICRVQGNPYRGYQYRILVWDDAQAMRDRIADNLRAQLPQS